MRSTCRILQKTFRIQRMLPLDILHVYRWLRLSSFLNVPLVTVDCTLLSTRCRRHVEFRRLSCRQEDEHVQLRSSCRTWPILSPIKRSTCWILLPSCRKWHSTLTFCRRPVERNCLLIGFHMSRLDSVNAVQVTFAFYKRLNNRVFTMPIVMC